MKTVTVVGVGALGSHVVQLLRNVEASIKVIDFDRVEQRNLLSQFHGEPNKGKSKVESIQKTMAFLFKQSITTVPHKLTGDNVEALLKGSDLVIECLDNAASRELVQKFVRAKGIPCLHGALSGDGLAGRAAWDEDFVIDEATAGKPTCEDGRHLPFIAITSAYIAYAAEMFLRTGRKPSFNTHPQGALRV